MAKDATREREAPGPAEQAPRRSRERGAPHPALSAGFEEPAEVASGTGVPSPKDRLKQAFSAEIPASLMDRESAMPRTPPRARRGR